MPSQPKIPESIHPAKRKRPPMQPVIKAKDDFTRFQANRLVLYLLENGALDLTQLALVAKRLKIPRSDQEQFAQLIGYSVSGFCSLSYVSNRTARLAEARATRTRTR